MWKHKSKYRDERNRVSLAIFYPRTNRLVGLCWTDQLHFERFVGGTLSQNFLAFHRTLLLFAWYGSLGFVHILKQIITVRTRYTTFLSHISVLSFHLSLGFRNPFSWFFHKKMQHECLLRSILATCPDHLHFIDLIIIIMLGKVYKLWKSSLQIFIRLKCKSSSQKLLLKSSLWSPFT